MRYALRKQDKIATAYGGDYLEEHIIASLDGFFARKGHAEVIEYIDDMNAFYETSQNSYQVLRINDLADKNAMLEFAVIGLKYDVLGLSFLGRMKG